MAEIGFILGKNSDANLQIGVRQLAIRGKSARTSVIDGQKNVMDIGLNKDTGIKIGEPLNRLN